MSMYMFSPSIIPWSNSTSDLLVAIANTYRYAGKKSRLRAGGLLRSLEHLGLGPYSHIKMHEFISYYDLDGCHSIDLIEFLELVHYEVRVVEETRPRRFYMKESKSCPKSIVSVSTCQFTKTYQYSTPQPLCTGGASGAWEVPSRGKASVKVQFCPVLTKAGHLAINKQIENFLRICPEFPNGKDPIRLSRTYLTLHPDQAQGIYDDILKLTGRTAILATSCARTDAVGQVVTALSPHLCACPLPFVH
jgi:hypothetical protein